MTELCTPRKKSLKEAIIIPPSPLLKKIGFGTGIAVYHLPRSPIQNRLKSPWAVKKLTKKANPSEIGNRLKVEAEILKKLNHENIVGFRGFIEKDAVLLMEELSVSLGDLIEERLEQNKCEPFPSKIIEKVASDISKALQYLHNEALILHCDIKSFNILIKGDFEVCKLCDFGVSLPLNREGKLDSNKVDKNVEYTGTSAWCPPEVLSWPQVITTKADIYSYGLVIWEMIAISPPPLDSDISDTLDSSQLDVSEVEVKRERPDLPEVELDDTYNLVLEIFYICTSIYPEKRPTADQLQAILFKKI